MAEKIRGINKIIDFLKDKEIKSDTDVAKLLGMTPQALYNHVRRETIPYDKLVTYCLKEGLSLEGILFEDGPAFGPHGIFSDDPQIIEIVKYLENNPDDRDAIHELIQAKRAAKKATEKFLKG